MVAVRLSMLFVAPYKHAYCPTPPHPPYMFIAGIVL